MSGPRQAFLDYFLIVPAGVVLKNGQFESVVNSLMMSAIQKADPGCFYYYHDIKGILSRYYIAPIG